MALRDAIQTYHDLLSDELAAATQAQLDDQHRRRGIYFGTRPLATVLRPRLLTPEQWRALEGRVQVLLGAFERIYRAAFEDAAIRAQFALQPWEDDLASCDPGYREPSPTARLDTFYLPDEGQLHVVEYNAETPAGQSYSEVLTEVYLGLPVMREFLRRYAVRPLPARPGMLHALLGAYAQWDRGRRTSPRIAILDWREVPTSSEFVLAAEYLRTQGLDCRIVDPRDVEYRDGQLIAAGGPITLVYKRVLLSELYARGGAKHPVLCAVRDGAVCMVNSARCKILHKKASLAVLSDERNEQLFTAEQRQAIAAHIPWTRRVEERHTRYGGQVVDLVPFIVERREQLLLKANDDYGGKGVYLGWETEPAAWEAIVSAALDAPFVVQERVAVPTEPYPSLIDAQVALIERNVDTDPFISNGSTIDGCLTRLSTAALLNVTAGGGSTVPTFLVERR